jgi:pimeloyl-ACP methyl ester carboxylesterase
VLIHYETHGHGGSLPPLLLSHGFGASTEMWAPNLDTLGADRQVITWDIRGHGLSDSPADPDLYSEELSVADMAAVLDSANVDRAIVGGLSLGGYLSLAFNLRHPERVIGLVLCDTGPGYRRDEARQQWNAWVAGRADELERLGVEALGGGAEVRASRQQSARGLSLAARGILAQHDSRVIDSLASIAVPTLVLVGADDTRYLDAAEVMAAKIPGATKTVIEGAGHAANMDQPEAFNRAVTAFLQSLPAGFEDVNG